MNNSGGALSFDAVIRDTDFKRQLDSMEQQLKGFGRTAEIEGEKMESSFKKVGIAMGAYFTFTAAQQFISKMIQIRGEFQQLEIGLKTMLGSKEKADKLFAEMVDLAAKTPFTLNDVAAGGKMLIAYGTSAEIVTEKLRQLGDIAAGTNAPLQDLVYLYGTSRTQGRLFQRDILQFAGRGVPIFTELAKVMGVTEKEVTGLVSAGKVGFEELDKVIVNLTSDGGMFFNLMKEQSASVTGQLSNLEDAFDVMLNTIGESSEGFIYSGISATTVLIENYEKIGKIIMELVVIYGSYRAALIALNAMETVRTGLIMAQATSTGTVTLATYIYTAALAKLKAMQLAIMATNPYTWVAMAVAGIAGLIGYLEIFADTSDDATKAAKQHAEAIEKVNQQLDKETAKVSVLVSTARNEALLRRTRISALKELKSVSNGWLDNLTLENVKTKEGIGLLEDYNKELRRSITLKGNEDEMVATITRLNEITREKEALQDKINKAETRIGTSTGRVNEYKPLDDTWEKRKNVLLDERTKLMNEETELTLHLKSLENDRLKIASDFGKKAEEVSITDKLTIAQIDEQIKKHKEDLELVKEGEKVQYDKIQAEIKALEDRKKAITGGSEKDNNKAESEALKGEMKLFSEHLENKKRLYELYDRWVAATGETAANEQFSVLLKSGKTYSEWIAGEIARLKGIENKTAVQLEQLKYLSESQSDAMLTDEDARVERFKSNIEKRLEAIIDAEKQIEYLQEQMADIPTIGEENIKKRLTVLEKLKEIQEQTQADDIAAYREGMIAYSSLEQQKVTASKKAQKLIAEFIKNGEFDRAFAAQKANKEILAGIDAQSKAVIEKMKLLDVDYSTLSSKQLKTYLELIKGVFAKINLTPEAKEQVDAYILAAETELSGRTIEGLTISVRAAEVSYEAAKGTDQEAAAYAKLIDARRKQVQGLAKDFGAVAGIIGQMSAYVGEFNEGLSRSLQIVSNLAGNLSNAISELKPGGDTLSGFLSVVSIVQSVADELDKQFGLQKRIADQAEKQAEYIKHQQANLALITYELEKQIELLEKMKNFDKISGYEETLKALEELALQSEQALYSMKFKLEVAPKGIEQFLYLQNLLDMMGETDPFIALNKALSDGLISQESFDLAISYLNAIKETGQSIEDIKKAQIEYVTGSTTESITDGIVAGFEQGWNSAADFGDTFEDIMKKAILNSMKMFIDPKVQAWIENFQNDMLDGILTEDEKAARKAEWDQLIAEGNAWMEGVGSIVDFNESDSGALAASIKGVSEETASLVAGQMNAMRLNQSEMINIFEQQIFYQAEIASNTRFLSLLVSINDKMGATPNPGEI